MGTYSPPANSSQREVALVFAGAEVILFGTQAGVRLFGASRQAYIDKTRGRGIMLPLPGVDHSAAVGQAESCFAVNPDGSRHLAESERLRELHAPVGADRAAFELDRSKVDELVLAFVYFRGIDKGLTARADWHRPTSWR